jgi:tetratricopeptide (TPR) repeat protein
VTPSSARRAGLVSAAVVFGFSLGCATLPPPSLAPGPGARVLEDVPVRIFDDDRCGPGSLSIVLNALGDPVSAEELEAELPRAPEGGVLSVDLLLVARQRGFGASLVTGDAAAVADEIRAGRPAVLLLRLLNAPGRRHDVYHYVVVDGMDETRQLFRFQFGDGKERWVRLDRLEGAWNGAGHALLTFRAPPPLAAMRAAVELERAGRLDEAARGYRQVLEAHPDHVQAWVDLGNVEAARSRRRDAEAAYRRALELAPHDTDALNNLAWLLLGEGERLEEAERLARAAAAGAGPDSALVLDTLARVQVARGRCAEAEATLAEGLGLSGLSAAGRSALDRTRREVLESACRAP